MSDFGVTTDISIEQATQMLAQIPGQVYQQLTTRGFAYPQQPSIQTQGGSQPYNGYLPPDLTKLTDQELGYYLGMLSTWLDYVQVQLAEAHMNLTIAEKQLELIEAKLYMLHRTEPGSDKKRTEQERKSLVISDRRFVETQHATIYAETFYRYVKAIASGAEQNYSAVSRRISQRQQDIDRGSRTTNANNIPSGPLFRRP